MAAARVEESAGLDCAAKASAGSGDAGGLSAGVGEDVWGVVSVAAVYVFG